MPTVEASENMKYLINLPIEVVVWCGLLTAGWMLGGCAMGPGPGPRSSRMDEITALEDEIDSQVLVSYGAGECHDRCRAAESICDCAGQICTIASDIAELSALESCRRAEAACSAARLRANEGCACDY